jgi:WD40 repeat protein
MMISDVETLKSSASWEGSSERSRSRLLGDVQKYVRKDFMVAESRLDSLMLQALDNQVSKWQVYHWFSKLFQSSIQNPSIYSSSSLYHNVNEKVFSLYQDHACDRSQFPTRVSTTFDDHGDEVWFVQFSPCGSYIASSSKDSCVYVFELEVCHFIASGRRGTKE